MFCDGFIYEISIIFKCFYNSLDIFIITCVGTFFKIRSRFINTLLYDAHSVIQKQQQ